MAWFMLAFDDLLSKYLGPPVDVWSTLVFGFLIVPAVLGVSFGIHKYYMMALLSVFEWATLQMEQKAKEKNHHLYKHYTSGIIDKNPDATLQRKIQDLRHSADHLSLEPRFDLADVFFFCQKALESIIDDDVTKCFSAQELESWNLLTRSNHNFRYISVKLLALWVVGVLIRYGVLLPFRLTMCLDATKLIIVASFLYDPRLRTYLSDKVHLMGYRLCVRSLTGIITYHNRSSNNGLCVNLIWPLTGFSYLFIFQWRIITQHTNLTISENKNLKLFPILHNLHWDSVYTYILIYTYPITFNLVKRFKI
uniref:Glycerol-3-phosphate acyltransferase 4 n=1 Tax=Fundulus heteroclitus TaxID=8078 RepID=A0A3Q2NUK8_FUNHE